MRIDELEAVLEQLDGDGRRPKFIYSVPSFQNPAGVTMSLERRRRLVELAREHELLVVEDNPYGLLRYGGEPLPPLYQLDGGDFVIYIGTFSKILSPGIRLGWAVAPPPVMEKIVLGKQAADLCTSTLTQYFVREYFAEGRWREYVESLVEIYRGRRDTMLAALGEHFPAGGDLDRAGGRPLHLGDAARLHRHRRPAGEGAARRRRLRPRPGRLRRRARPQLDAAQLLRRRRGGDPRGHPPDRQGDRRAGRALRDADRRAPRGSSPQACGEAEPRTIRPSLPFRKSRRGRRMKVAVLKGGRSLERGVSLRSGARVEDALERLGHEAVPLDVGADLVERLLAEAPDVAFVAMHGPRRRGRHRAGAARDPRHPLHRPRRRRLRALHGQGAGQARAARGRGADAGLVRLQPDRLPRARRRRRARRARGAARLPAGRQAEPRRLLARGQVRRRARPRCRRRWSPPSATTTGSCSSASSTGASWRSACSATRRCRSSRRSRPRATATTSRPATRSAAPASSARPSSTRPSGRRSPRRRSAPTGRSAAPASRAST